MAYLRKKFYSKLCTIRHLQKALLPNETLVKVYTAFIRPVIEYANTAYHCLLTLEQSNSLERLQLQALKMIFGNKISYRKCLEKFRLERLDERRLKAMQKFAQKAMSNPRFSKKWFPLNESTDKNTRSREKYKIFAAKHDRLRDGTLNTMRRYLNGLENE